MKPSLLSQASVIVAILTEIDQQMGSNGIVTQDQMTAVIAAANLVVEAFPETEEVPPCQS